MKNKKILILPVIALMFILSFIVNLKPLYAAQGDAVTNFLPSDATPLYDDLGQFSGISWDNDPTTEFNETGLYVVTINNLLKDPFFNNSTFMNASGSDIYFPENRVPSIDTSFSFIVDISADQTTLKIEFLNEYGFSALKDTLTIEDFNSTNISMRAYRGETDDLYTYTSKKYNRLLDITANNNGTDTLHEALSNIGIYVNDDTTTYPLETYGEFSMELELIDLNGLTYNGLTDSYKNVFYNQVSGPTTWAEANPGDELVFESTWYDPLLDSFSPEPHTITITLFETLNNVNPALRIMDKTYPLALSNDSINVTISESDFNPQNSVTIADGDYFGAGNYLGNPQEYTFKSFAITKGGVSAIDYYLFTNDIYDASITFTGADLNDYTFNFTLTTDFPPVAVFAKDVSDNTINSDSRIDINEKIIMSEQSSYEAMMTYLNNYLSFSLDDSSIVVPEISYLVCDSDNIDVTNTTWFNQKDIYSIEYTYKFDGLNADDYIATYIVEVYENEAPEISGPTKHSIPIDIDDFSEDYILSLYSFSDDLDEDTDLTTTVSSLTFDFESSEILLNDNHTFVITVTDSNGLSSTVDLNIEIYEPIKPTNIFKVLMSISSSLIFVLAGVYIFKKLKK